MTNDERQLRMRPSLIALLTLSLAATASLPEPAEAAGRKVLFHLQTGITQDDNPMCAAFNVALAAVESGDEVEMFFDAGAVFDLQDAPTRGGSEGTASQPSSQPAAGQGARPTT